MKKAKSKKQKFAPINPKKNKIKFENISYEQWVQLVPNVLNYDLQLTTIETLDHMLLLKMQLVAYIDAKGIVPNEYINEVHQLEQDEQEAKKIKKDLEISEYDTSFKTKSQEELDELEKRLHPTLIKDMKFDDSKKAFLYFRNPFFIHGDQRFNQRLPELKKELSGYEWIIKKELKPAFKRSKNLMELIAVDIRRILMIDDPRIDVSSLAKFIHPYIDNIMNSDNYYYQELVSLSL